MIILKIPTLRPSYRIFAEAWGRFELTYGATKYVNYWTFETLGM